MKKSPGQGFALATLMMLIPLILILVAALFAALRAGNRWTGAHYGETSASFVAEAGAAHALEQLKIDPAWEAGFSNLAMANGKGSYSITFNQSKLNFQKTESVNNFDGEHADSFLGTNTVPPGSALLVVNAKVGVYAKTSMFIVGTGDSTIRVDQALLTSGKIAMEGETKITAVESIAKQGSLPAEVQSNQNSGGSDLVTWAPGSDGGSLLIEGEVKSSGSSSSAVDLSGYTPSGGVTIDAAKVTIPPAGISTRVFGKRSATPFSGGSTVPSGDNYHDATASPLIISGDLVLDGDLYVEGELQVTGSIRGNGSVFVSGNTELFGDSKIDSDDKVALYSQGHVTLSGFDGDKYLDGIAASDPTFSTWLDDSRWAMNDIQTKMLNGNWSGADRNALDDTNSVLSPFWNPGDRGSLIPGRSGATLSRMKDSLMMQPPSPSRDFMIEKLGATMEIFAQNGNVLGRPDSTALANFQANGDTSGIIDAANDLNDPAHKLAAFNVVRQINYDRVGSSYFQGLVYTNGGFYADNQVTVLGAVVVNDDGSQTPYTTASGATIQPGDLTLKGGSNITYVKDFFHGPNSGGTPGPRKILLNLGDG